MPNLSYGSITITDLTDVGQLSVYPTSNMPNTIIYNEDENSYTPNWANESSHLELNPVIYYAGDSLAPNASGVTVVWSKKIDIGATTTITTNSSTGQSINATTKKLTVSKNPLGTNNATVCYIVTVTYVEPSTQKTLTAEGQITFSLLKQVSTAKTCSIVGDNIFKYNESRNIQGATSITLTASYKNVNISDWQYLNSSGNWVRHSNFNSSDLEHLTISHTDAGFINDRLSIKLVTSDNDTYDIHTIMKLYDGVPGTSTIAGVLSNEDQMIACQSDGTPISYDGAESFFTVFEGGTDVTSQWAITITSSGVTYQKSTTNKGTLVASSTQGTNFRYVKVTGITADSASITFTAKKSGKNDIVKVFSLVKIKTGQDGTSPTIYDLRCSAVAINKANLTNTFNPSTVTIEAYSKTGNGNYTAYAGRFVVKAGSTNIYTSSNNESSYTLTTANLTSAVSNKFLTVELYLAGGTTTKVDSQTITITTDGPQGPKGKDGDDGKGAINVILGNQAAVIPCTSGNVTVAATTILIPFIAYQGTEPVECNVDSTALTAIASTNPTVTKQGTAANSYEGLITYSIGKSKSVSAASGEVTLKFTVTDKDSQTHIINQKFSWTRSTAATNGVNAVLLQLSTPGGNIFYKNSAETLSIVGTLTDGAQDKTSSVTSWKWEKYVPGTGYQTDSSSTTNTITVNKSAVNGYVSYKCTATYGTGSNNKYIQYYSLLDWTDPLQVAVFCSFGDQITNRQGVGALYVIVTQGNEEVDAIKTKVFSETAPSNPTAGAYYYQLNKTNKTVKLMKYVDSSWTDVTTAEPYSGTYAWSFRGKDGNELTTTLANDKKVIYIDGSFIDKKIIADVAVTL